MIPLLFLFCIRRINVAVGVGEGAGMGSAGIVDDVGSYLRQQPQVRVYSGASART